MPYYHKCRNCAVDTSTCQRRQAIRSAIKGLGLTSIKFQCLDRKPLFRVGQRIEFDWAHYDESARDYYGEVVPDDLKFRGTVASENEDKGTFVVQVDQDPVQSNIEFPDLTYTPNQVFKNGGFAVRVKPASMRAIDEPDREICPDCLAYDVGERCFMSEYCRPSSGALCMGGKE